MTFVSALEPRPVWSHFDTILTIPRASKDEERMRQHVIAAATRAGCDHAIDPAGNVVVRKPATAGHEPAPVTILQSHLDMVQEKNADVAFDFRTDAIVPRREGEHLYATGTTLGSDNGIGVATMLAVMDSTDLVHGAAGAAVHDRRGDRPDRSGAVGRRPPLRTPADQSRLRGRRHPVRRLRGRRRHAALARRDAGGDRRRRPGGDGGPAGTQGRSLRLRYPPAARGTRSACWPARSGRRTPARRSAWPGSKAAAPTTPSRARRSPPSSPGRPTSSA